MSDAIEPDEILPPGSQIGRRARSVGDGPGPKRELPRDPRGLISSLIAYWLDDVFRIPGTKFSIGLDPILALIPGIGDAAATGVGSAILLSALKNRAPVRILGRMAGNMAVNAVLGAIPGVGAVLSVWFKSNSRNNDMLQRHLAGQPPGPASPQAKWVGFFVLAMPFVILGINIAVWWLLWKVVRSAF